MKPLNQVEKPCSTIPKSDAHILVLFSGGRDSSCVLKLLLEKTSNELHVYHASHRTHNHKWEAEDQAAENVKQYFETRNRPFHYSSSIIDQTSWNHYETFNSLTDVAISLVKEYGCNYVASGRKRIGSFTTRPELFWKQHDYQKKVGVPWVYPVWEMSNQQVADYLGKELCAMTWTCGIPIKTDSGWKPC